MIFQVCSALAILEFGAFGSLAFLHVVNIPLMVLLIIWAHCLWHKTGQIQHGTITGCAKCMTWTFCFITMTMCVFNLPASWICLWLDLTGMGLGRRFPNWGLEVFFFVIHNFLTVASWIYATRLVKVMFALKPPEYFQPPTQVTW